MDIWKLHLRQLLTKFLEQEPLNDWEGGQTDKEDTIYSACKRVIVVYMHTHMQTQMNLYLGKQDIHFLHK